MTVDGRLRQSERLDEFLLGGYALLGESAHDPQPLWMGKSFEDLRRSPNILWIGISHQVSAPTLKTCRNPDNWVNNLT
jgi:hypothetical protein